MPGAITRRSRNRRAHIGPGADHGLPERHPLRQACRQVDLVARYGGEEFCMVFAEADAALAERACERAREAVEQQDWSDLHPSLRVTISIGLADHPSLDSPQALLADADAQLYAAKRAGKNRVSRFS